MPIKIRISERVGRSISTVARWLARLGPSSLRALERRAPIVRYEHAQPGVGSRSSAPREASRARARLNIG